MFGTRAGGTHFGCSAVWLAHLCGVSKGGQQWELERRFRQFESELPVQLAAQDARFSPQADRSALRLRLFVALRNHQQNNPRHTKHSKRRILSVPRFGLPHRKPFAAHAQKRHQPHRGA